LRKEKTLKACNTDDAIVGGEGMSADRTSDDADDANLPAVERDAVSTGAAADSADSDGRLNGLPRLLRFAMLISGNARHIKQRLVAEINELCPNLPLNAAWAAASDVGTGLALAAELDHRAVIQNEPNLRSLADCVRLLCLPLPRDTTHFEEYRSGQKRRRSAGKRKRTSRPPRPPSKSPLPQWKRYLNTVSLSRALAVMR
jgi:hypothetical protein